MSKVILKAFLEKRSIGKSVVVSNLGYNKRWFVLDNEALTYYDGKKSKQGTQKGKILLNMIRGVEEVDDYCLDQKRNVVQVIHSCKERFDFMKLYIVTRSKEDQDKWIHSIREGAISAGAVFLDKYHPGVWINGMFTCCNKQGLIAKGCKEMHLASSGISSSSQESHERKPPNRTLPEAPNREQPAPLDTGKEKGSSGGGIEKKRLSLTIKYQAMYSYQPTAGDELELQKGQILEIQNELDKDWWTATNIENGASGLVPTSYLKEITSLEYYSWYFEGVSKEDCRSLLEGQQAGCFLVRDSSDKRRYTLSVFDGVTVKHFRIENTADNKVFITEGREFSSVPALIEHYHKNQNIGSTNCKLTGFPLPERK